jgi:hypothetical protein
MTSEGLGEMFEGDSADTLAGKLPLVSMGSRAEGIACADPVVRTPIGTSGNLFYFMFQSRYNITVFNISNNNNLDKFYISLRFLFYISLRFLF